MTPADATCWTLIGAAAGSKNRHHQFAPPSGAFRMDTIGVAEARKAEAVGRTVRLCGWVRTRRDSKGGFSFIEVNDGSCHGNVQVVAAGELPNCEDVVKNLTVGASVAVEGHPSAGQPPHPRSPRPADRAVHGDEQAG